MSLGANVSLFAASRQPERVRGLVLEMPVLEWAVPHGRHAVRAAAAPRALRPPPLGGARRPRVVVPATPFPTLNGILHAAALPPKAWRPILHGVLVGPVAPTEEERAQIDAPAFVLAHGNDLIHPFDDANKLADELPNAQLVRARSPIELRCGPIG